MRQPNAKRGMIWVWSVLVILFLLVGCRVVSAHETVRITNGEWPLYLSEKLPHQGFASHVVSEAFAAMGVPVVYGFNPWARSYRYAADGKDLAG